MPQTVSPDDCLFCKIANHQIDAQIVHEDDDFVAFRDINPQAPLHLLIIPRCHIGTLNDLTPDDASLVGRMSLLASRLARQFEVDQQGYRLIFNCNEGAGQSVWHIHMHLLGGRELNWPPG